MVKFVQCAFDLVRVLGEGLFGQLVYLGGRSSSVSKEGCGDVEFCCAMEVLKFHRC